MVDFDSEATVSTAPAIIVKIMLLERRKNLIDAFEFYYKQKLNLIQPNIGILGSRLIALYYEIYEDLKRFYKEEEFKALNTKVFSKKYEEYEEAFKLINRWYDEKKLTRIDTIKKFDSTRVEIEHEEKGL